jgi:hypothetical protein
MDDKMQINAFKIKCHKQKQVLKKHRCLEDGQIYYIGQCIICKKHFIFYNGIFLEGRAAKRLFLKIKDKIKEIKQSNIYRIHSKLDNNIHYYKLCRRLIKNKKGDIVAISEYQSEKRYNSNYATGFKTKTQKTNISRSCIP